MIMKTLASLVLLTVSLAHKSKPPKGANKMPTRMNVGSTVFGVRIGCHAFSRCCLKAVSSGSQRSRVMIRYKLLSTTADRTIYHSDNSFC